MTPPAVRRIEAPCRRISPLQPGRFYFFGYYDKCPWNASGRYVLGLETCFQDRLQQADDTATVGLLDLQNGCTWVPVAQTLGWSWQQGAMAQWAPWAPESQVLFNARDGSTLVTRIRDLPSGATRTLPLPVSAVAPDGRWAVSTNFPRRYYIRAGYGYAGVADRHQGEAAPEGDGLWSMDLASGEHRLLVSLAHCASEKPDASMDGAVHWLDLEGFRPDSERVLFFHRWFKQEKWWTRIYTVGIDGGGLFLLHESGMFSHFCWRDNEHLLAWAQPPGSAKGYYLFRDGTREFQPVGAGLLTVDGHCSYSPDGRWLLTDTYPDRERLRTLILFRMEDQQKIEIGRFYAPREIDGEIRCDLHPRWSRDGREVCIDSVHEGARAMYVVDVAAVVVG